MLLPRTAEPPHSPAPAGLRDRKKEKVRAAIVDAALDLFATEGYDETTVQDIAARADVSPATVARYFPSKVSLLFAERDERVAALRRAIVERPPGEAPLQAVIAALADQPPVAPDGLDRLLRSRTAIAKSSTLRGRSLELLDEWRDGMVEALLERAVRAESARVLATAIVAVLDDVSSRWAAAGGPGDFNRRLAEALRAFENLWTE